MKHLLPLCLLVVLASCGKKDKPENLVFFSGQIVHPTSDYVVLHKGDEVIDSAKLDKNNRFSIEIENLEPGLHHFQHAPEYQYVYLEPGDSILIRLNTMAFDESLAFFGSNEQINNFLIEMYLSHEDEEELISTYYRLSPEEFRHKMDSLRDMKMEELQTLLNEVEMSEEAREMGQAVIDFGNYVYREKYPFVHKKKMKDVGFPQLPKDFYAYRSELNVSSEQLSYLEPYYDFLKYHFGNLTYMACMDTCAVAKPSQKDFLHLNTHKLRLIDSMVDQETLKNNLMRNVALDYLIKVHRADPQTEDFIALYEGFSSHQGHKEEIRVKFKGIQELQFGAPLPAVKVWGMDNNQVSFPQISKGKHTLFYFWSGRQMGHFKNVTRQLDSLQSKRPDWQFVGINLETSDQEWRGMVRKMQVDTALQFRVSDSDQIRHLLHDLNQCIIAQDTIVLNGFAHMKRTPLLQGSQELASQ